MSRYPVLNRPHTSNSIILPTIDILLDASSSSSLVVYYRFFSGFVLGCVLRNWGAFCGCCMRNEVVSRPWPHRVDFLWRPLTLINARSGRNKVINYNAVAPSPCPHFPRVWKACHCYFYHQQATSCYCGESPIEKLLIYLVYNFRFFAFLPTSIGGSCWAYFPQFYNNNNNNPTSGFK